jgi:hypothetical protein
MSRLANMIEAIQTGRVKVVQNSLPITVIKEDWSPVLSANLRAAKEYRLGVTLQVKGFSESDSGKDLVHLKDMCKRQILHEVFGEFQPLLRRVERSLYELNFDEARTALQELENEMRW